MLIYIVVFAVVLIGLWAAYRSLGAPGAAVADPGMALTALWLSLDAVITSLTSPDAALPEAAHEGRRAAAAAAQQLARLGRDPSPSHDLLAAAAEDCGWAGRLMEAETYAGNPGMQAAVAALLDHSRRCLEEVAILAG